MKVRAKNLNKEQNIETLDALYTAAASLHGRDAMKHFLRDLLTESERIMLGRRIVIARKLLLGSTNRAIADELGVGFDTIARVERWLEDQMPGYETAIRGLETELLKRKRKSADAAILAKLKQKFPVHFLLFPWPKGYKSPKVKDK